MNLAEELAEEDVARYDRQIRLWGYETQKRLMATLVCIVGVDEISMEAAKNLAAAGVNMAIMDENPYNGQFVSVIPMESMFDPMPTVSGWFAKCLRRMNASITLEIVPSMKALRADAWRLVRSSSIDSLTGSFDKTICYHVTDALVTVVVIRTPGDVEHVKELVKTRKGIFEGESQGAASLLPPEAAIVGGLIAQFITSSINGEQEHCNWNTITYRRCDMSATVSWTEMPETKLASSSSLSTEIEQLEID